MTSRGAVAPKTYSGVRGSIGAKIWQHGDTPDMILGLCGHEFLLYLAQSGPLCGRLIRDVSDKVRVIYRKRTCIFILVR